MTGRGSSHAEHRNVEKGLSNVQCEHLHMFAAIFKKSYAAVRLARSTTSCWRRRHQRRQERINEPESHIDPDAGLLTE